VGLRHDEPEPDAADPDQIGLFDGRACRNRVFVTNMDSGQWSPAEVVAFYHKRDRGPADWWLDWGPDPGSPGCP